jgi:hypothetical protein
MEPFLHPDPMAPWRPGDRIAKLLVHGRLLIGAGIAFFLGQEIGTTASFPALGEEGV